LGESRGLGDLVEPGLAVARGEFPQFPQALSIFFVVGARIVCSQILWRRSLGGDATRHDGQYSITTANVKYYLRMEFLRTIWRKNPPLRGFQEFSL
jgi:hypothetical protein